MNRDFINLPMILVVILLTHPMTAHAYLDPGTGSLIIQGLLAAIAGALVTGKIYWYRIKEFWFKLTTRNSENSQNELEHAQSKEAPEKD